MRKKILTYFNNPPAKYKGGLKVLDITEANYYYTGVTLKYIWEFVLKKQFSKVEVSDEMLTLHRMNKVKALYCPTVDNVVFETLYTDHWNYNKDDDKYKEVFLPVLNAFKTK